MNIRRVVEADFRFSELSIFQQFEADHRSFVKHLKDDDVILFLSKTGKQMVFMHGVTSFMSGAASALMSTRHRLLTGEWNPLKLKNYAEAVGLKIEGLQRFEEHYKHLLHGSHTVVKKAA